jgi:hypothetical protein
MIMESSPKRNHLCGYPSTRCKGPDEVLSIFSREQITKELESPPMRCLRFFVQNIGLIAHMALDCTMSYPAEFYRQAAAILSPASEDLRKLICQSDEVHSLILKFPRLRPTSAAFGRYCHLLEFILLESGFDYYPRIPDGRAFLACLLDSVLCLPVATFLEHLFTDRAIATYSFLEASGVTGLLLDRCATSGKARAALFRLLNFLIAPRARNSPLVLPLQDPAVLLPILHDAFRSDDVSFTDSVVRLVLTMHGRPHSASRVLIEAIDSVLPSIFEYLQNPLPFTRAKISAILLVMSIVQHAYLPEEFSSELPTPVDFSRKKEIAPMDSIDLFQFHPAFLRSSMRRSSSASSFTGFGHGIPRPPAPTPRRLSPEAVIAADIAPQICPPKVAPPPHEEVRWPTMPDVDKFDFRPPFLAEKDVNIIEEVSK